MSLTSPSSSKSPDRSNQAGMRRRGILLALTGAVLWGGSGVAGQYILQDCAFATEWLVGVRMLISGALLLLIDLAVFRQDIFAVFRGRRDRLETIAFAIFGMLGVQYTYFAAIKFSNAATGTILQYLMPVVIVGWTALRTRRMPPFGELACVALAVYAAQPGKRLLAEKKGVDVAAARKDYGVHAVERRKDYLRIIRGRKHYGNASCLLNAQVVAFGQFAAFIAEVSRYGNYRPQLMVWKTAVELAVACPDVEGFLLPVTIFHALCC